MTAVITHSVSAGGTVDATADVDGAAWDANHVITGVMAPEQGGTGVVNNAASTITISGSFGATFTLTGTTSVTFPTSGTLATTSDKLSAFAATTSAELAGVISDETGTGALVFANSPTLVTPALGTPASGVLTNATGLPLSTGITGAGTGVLTALAVNVGSAGAFVTFNGALGTPSSGTLTNATGLPVASGISGFGTGVATALAVNVGSAGAPVVNGGALGTPSSGTLTNATGLPLTTGVTGNLPVGNLNSGTFASATTFWRGDATWAVPAGGGTVTSTIIDGLDITSTGTAPPRYGYANATIAVSAAASALTIALKDNAGSDPSATSPAAFWFRSATTQTGTWSLVSATGAMSLVLSSGSTLGVTSSTAFRIWIVMFNDAGTLRLGAINCASTTGVFALNSAAVASSTAEGGAGAADSAGVFYTGTAVTSKAFVVIGYAEWSATGLTAGTWTTTNHLYTQSFGAGVHLPGSTIQRRTGTTSTQFSTTSSTYQTTNLTTSITPTSAANRIVVRYASDLYNRSTAGEGVYASIFRGSTQIGPEFEGFATNNQVIVVCSGFTQDAPNTTSSTTYAVKIRNDAATANMSFPGIAHQCEIVAEEIMV